MLSSILKLINDYGFVVVFAALSMITGVWIIRQLLGSLQKQTDAMNSFLTNHFPHLHEEVTQVKDGQDTIVLAIQAQTEVVREMLSRPCPLRDLSKKES